jgi:hypothetical protein
MIICMWISNLAKVQIPSFLPSGVIHKNSSTSKKNSQGARWCLVPWICYGNTLKVSPPQESNCHNVIQGYSTHCVHIHMHSTIILQDAFWAEAVGIVMPSTPGSIWGSGSQRTFSRHTLWMFLRLGTHLELLWVPHWAQLSLQKASLDLAHNTSLLPIPSMPKFS